MGCAWRRLEGQAAAVPDTNRTPNPMIKLRKQSLETSTSRLRLPIQKKPHWHRLRPGLSLGYRRNEGPGTWSIRATDGKGGKSLKRFGVADDYEPADGALIFSFTQAVEAARKLTRGGDDKAGQLVTLKGALAAYEADLRSRGASAHNATWPLAHLPAALLARPIALIDAAELRRWRDSLSSPDRAPATVNRLIKAVRAALNLAAEHDPRIKSRQPWQVGLQPLPDATRARDCILTDDEVRALIAAAHAREGRFGLLIETLAVTGARPSQVARLEVGDLRVAEAKLMMPKSGKGGGKLRVKKKVERISVPITPALTARLKAAAAGRSANAPLLLWQGDRSWGIEPSANYRAGFRAIVAEVGLDPETTAYALRHSAIVRELIANVPIRMVAATHDTSVTEIERHYSKFITEHSDLLSRKALLRDKPASGNVHPLRANP